MRSELNERCRLIQGSFAGSKIPAKPLYWRTALFTKAAPEGWRPQPGEYVYLRPGVTVGGLNVDRAEVTGAYGKIVDIRVQNIRRWKSRLVNLADVRPVKP